MSACNCVKPSIGHTLSTADSLLTDTYVKWTPMVGSYLSLLPLFESF